jgi:glycosyltransferase involved in cell wall biosynthesis
MDLYPPVVQREAETLADAGFDVEVILMQHPERPRRTSVNGVSIISLPSSREKSSRSRYMLDYVRYFLLCAWTLTVRHLRRPYAAVQVNTMPDFLVFAAIGPKLLGSRIIAHMDEPTPELAATVGLCPGWLIGVLVRVEQWAIRFADHSITVTDQLKRRYVERGADADRMTVVRCGAAPETVLASWSPPRTGSGQRFTVVCHGAIEERYGLDTIIEAAGLLTDKLPDIEVVLTGRGSGVDEMLRLIDRAGLQDVVRFEGWVDRTRLNDILYTADAGVIAQKASAYSHLVQTNKMVDYWIFGLPVIASRLRAVSEMYDDSVIEYFEPGDPGSLADAILRLHDDPDRRAELAENGRRAHASHGWGAHRATYLGVYQTLLGQHP